MFASQRLSTFAARQFTSFFSTTSARASDKTVAVLGAAGGIGQPVSLLLKQSSLISSLRLYDIVNAPGVAADISHINTRSEVRGYSPENDGLKHAIEGADIIVVPAGVPRKPGMTRDDLFNTNAGIVRDLATAAAQYSPKACLLIISNPVNSTVPIVAEVFKKHGVFDPKKIFGVTTLDVVRASRFVSEVNSSLAPDTTVVPVIGGHSGVTIIPLLSRVSNFSQEQLDALTKRIQYGGDEVVQAKGGTGSATLSMAFAAARFTLSLIKAQNKEGNVVEPSFVHLDADPEGGAAVRKAVDGLDFFSTPITLGPEGVSAISPIADLSDYEKKLLEAAIPELKKNISKGVSFVTGN